MKRRRVKAIADLRNSIAMAVLPTKEIARSEATLRYANTVCLYASRRRRFPACDVNSPVYLSGSVFSLGGNWFSRYHPQTQLLRLVTVVGGLQQSLKSL